MMYRRKKERREREGRQRIFSKKLRKTVREEKNFKKEGDRETSVGFRYGLWARPLLGAQILLLKGAHF